MSHNDPDACQLNGEFKSCCCTCRFHIRDYHHCTTPEGSKLRKETGNKCVCSVTRGWICAGFLLSGDDSPECGVHSGWGEHGMCEMHSPRTTPSQGTSQGEKP